MSLVEVRELRVRLDAAGQDIVRDVSLEIEAGEILALVGESGSGKTTVANALLGYARRGATLAGGSVEIDGVPVFPAPLDALRLLRGKVVAYIPQDPAAALNPAIRIGEQIEETLIEHGLGDERAERLERVRQVLSEVGLPNDGGFLKRFPHQLSGGQLQRVCIAIAIVGNPKVVVMDEPTTSLDVSMQAHVLRTLTRLVRDHDMAALYVTHDLAVVANIADRVMVLYAGHIVEYGRRRSIFDIPAHPYTRGLLGSAPDLTQRSALAVIPGRSPSVAERPAAGCCFAPRCQFARDECTTTDPPLTPVADDHTSACLRIGDVTGAGAPRVPLKQEAAPSGRAIALEVSDVSVSIEGKQILDGISLSLSAGECVALVGESGSGKTTLARSIVGLVEDRTGEVTFAGQTLPTSYRQYPKAAHQRLQYIFQSPYNSLNPRRTVGSTLATPIKHFFGADRRELQRRINDALERVSLDPRTADLYPDQLSGGERQRVAIARALVCAPQVLLCDEVTSALDVSVQAAIVDLLVDLQRSENLGILFVTHNIALVRSIADRVIVLSGGRVIEEGDVEAVIGSPAQDYTRTLISDTPTLTASA